VLNREHEAAGGFKLKEVLKFEDAGHVELLARCVRVWTFESALDPDAIKLSESIIKARRLRPLGSCRSPRRRRRTCRRLPGFGAVSAVCADHLRAAVLRRRPHHRGRG